MPCNRGIGISVTILVIIPLSGMVTQPVTFTNGLNQENAPGFQVGKPFRRSSRPGKGMSAASSHAAAHVETVAPCQQLTPLP